MEPKERPFPPPVVTAWVNGARVSAAALADELAYWADWAVAEDPDQ